MNTHLTVTRSIVSVIIGYFIFALTAFALFQISGQPPHQAAPFWFMLGTIIYGCVFAFVGGYVAAALSRRRPLEHGIAVAIVLALGATVSLLGTVGKGAIWSQVAALALMAPSAVLGGWLRAKKVTTA